MHVTFSAAGLLLLPLPLVDQENFGLMHYPVRIAFQSLRYPRPGIAPASRQQPGQPDQHPEAMVSPQERLDPNRPVQPINCFMTSITCAILAVRIASKLAGRIYIQVLSEPLKPARTIILIAIGSITLRRDKYVFPLPCPPIRNPQGFCLIRPVEVACIQVVAYSCCHVRYLPPVRRTW
ncbi:hypothetical protein L211DRAFT_274684 [Terfezia boudieri ATCC MYA-4762]|uniref:Uncharacterized protein n=1 Tax=Terfezia boudieri ATCC MYA-4762 TaxID=1051890 RepID=A0A3N4LKQ1_9PEZI|nr:hypothetical protein L211DRAFT_274684 [Terfezia boudieri ATCC MYA-4762]